MASVSTFGAPTIVALARSPKQAEALRSAGATLVIQPERDAAERLGRAFLIPELVDSIPMGPYSVARLAIPRSLVGLAVGDLGLSRLWITMLMIERPAVLLFEPQEDELLQEGDRLLLCGPTESIVRFYLESRAETGR